jgi:hypothetical protein
MKRMSTHKRLDVVVAIASLFWLGGCVEYTIETTLNADGSGERQEEMVVDEGEDVGADVSYSDFAYVMRVSEQYRWSYRIEVRDEDSVHVLQRRTQLEDFTSWNDLSDDVRIAGAASVDAGTEVGRLALGDVQFRNKVSVETGQVGEYTSFTYRESFYWENLLDILVESYVQFFTRTIDASFPDLAGQQRGELLGLVRGGLWSAVDQGVLDADDEKEERLASAFVRRMAPQAAQIVHESYPEADDEYFEDVFWELWNNEEPLGEFIEQKLPGVDMAINTEIIFRLNMPGRVTTSNSHDRDGTTLIWKFSPADAAGAPVEVFAESVVGR